jgi:hypothetical protein
MSVGLQGRAGQGCGVPVDGPRTADTGRRPRAEAPRRLARRVVGLGRGLLGLVTHRRAQGPHGVTSIAHG